MSDSSTTTRIVLASRPQGRPPQPISAWSRPRCRPGDGEVLLRNRYLTGPVHAWTHG